MYRYDDHDDSLEPYDWDDPGPPVFPESLEVRTENINRTVDSLKTKGFLVESDNGDISLTNAGHQQITQELRMLVEASFELFRIWVTMTRPNPYVLGNGTEFMGWLMEQWDSHGLA